MNLYQDLFGETQEDEELSDILTNMLACASNQDPESIKQVERLVEKTSGIII